jgi:hypothetical protein
MTRMTDKYAPEYTPPQRSELSPPVPVEEHGTADVVKDQAADLSQGSVQAGKQVAEVARQQASGVAAEAGRQGRDLVEQAQHQLEVQAAQGQQRLAKQLLSLSDELRSMADSSSQGGMAADLAHQAASRVHDAGQWLDDRRPRQVADEMQSFARRRPAVFLALAVGGGLVAGRLTRGLKDAHGDNSTEPAAGQDLSGQWAQPPDMTGYSPATAGDFSDQTRGRSVPANWPPTGMDPASQAGAAHRERSPLVSDDQAGRQGTR